MHMGCSINTNPHIVIFDGVCHLCQGAVQFIIKRDPQARFVFAPLQSELAQQLLAEFPELSADTDSVLLIKQQRCYLYSDAALEIARDLSGFWPCCRVLCWIPRAWRDAGYKWLARHRYRLFGRSEVCMSPSAELKSRFLGL